MISRKAKASAASDADDAKPDFIFRLRANLDILLKAERKVADCILANESQVIHFSITDLAQKAGASEATVVRLCRRFGFRGFHDMKIGMAQEMMPHLASFHEDLDEADDCASILRKVCRANMRAIEDTLRVTDPAELQKAVTAICKSRRILLLGVGGSHAVAKDAEHKLLKTGIPTTAHSDILMQRMAATLAQPDDVVIGISHTGSTRATVEALNFARQAGAVTICITQFVKSPIVKVSDICLFVMSKEFDYRSEANGSRIAQLCIIDSLYVAVAKAREGATWSNLMKARKAIVSQRF